MVYEWSLIMNIRLKKTRTHIIYYFTDNCVCECTSVTLTRLSDIFSHVSRKLWADSQKCFDEFIIFLFPPKHKINQISSVQANQYVCLHFLWNTFCVRIESCKSNFHFFFCKNRKWKGQQLTDGPGSKARSAAAKVQTYISVCLLISEPHSVGYGDHYSRASIRPLKSTMSNYYWAVTTLSLWPYNRGCKTHNEAFIHFFQFLRNHLSHSFTFREKAI